MKKIRLIGLITFFCILFSLPLGALDTGFVSPTQNDAAGWTNPNNAHASDNVYATSGIGGIERFKTFNFSIPTGSVILGIEAELEGKVVSGEYVFRGSLSWDGATFTSVKIATLTSSSDQTIVYGNSTDLWGRAWTATEFSNANFKIQFFNNPAALDDASIDHIRVKVYYNGNGVSFQPAAS